jgi:hypothetical protein
MRLPFGLDLKSIIVGALLAYFVVPRVLAIFNAPRTSVEP